MTYYVSHVEEFCIGPFLNIVDANKFATEQRYRVGEFAIVQEEELTDKERKIAVTPDEFNASAENTEAGVVGGLVTLANKLDDQGRHQSATELDDTLRKLTESNKRTNNK